MTVSKRRPFRCRVLRLHSWRRYRSPVGERFRVCTVCRKAHGPFVTPVGQPT